MPGLDKSLVEHILPIKEWFKPHKQSLRKFNPEPIPMIKEVQCLLKAGFIRMATYADWLSNIVLVIKKNGKVRVCIDFRDLNLAMSKDEYVMPIANILVDVAAKHGILSFMDRHLGYN